MDFYRDAVVVNRNYLRENGYFIANYKHPRTNIFTTDTVRLPEIRKIENNNTKVNFATSHKLSLTFYFEDNSKLSIEGKDVAELIYRYNLKLSIPKELGSVNSSTGFITLNSFKEQVNKNLILLVSNSLMNFNVQIPYNYSNGYSYDFSWTSCFLYFMKNKERILSNQINVVVSSVNDSLYKIKMNKGAMTYTTLINPNKALLTINGAGQSGVDGQNASGKSSVFVNSKGSVRTVAGNPGSSGTHGTNGHHITIFMPRSFTEYVGSISFITSGGLGGAGGKGGSGASIYHEDITLLEILFAPSGPSGANGAYGNNGKAGLINYIYSD